MADPSPDDLPLWEAVYNAGMDTPGTAHSAVAAEMRVLADRLFPEEPEPDITIVGFGSAVGYVVSWHRWNDRKQARETLLNAALECERHSGGDFRP